MITRVIASHAPGPFENGVGGCAARYASKGFCPGVQIAEWLNGLGDDDAPYGGGTVRNPRNPQAILTNGDVRDNYITAGNCHVKALEPELARLYAERRRTSASLRVVNKEIRRLEKARNTVGA